MWSVGRRSAGPQRNRMFFIQRVELLGYSGHPCQRLPSNKHRLQIEPDPHGTQTHRRHISTKTQMLPSHYLIITFLKDNNPIISHCEHLWRWINRVKWSVAWLFCLFIFCISTTALLMTLNRFIGSPVTSLCVCAGYVKTMWSRRADRTHHGLLDLVVYGHDTGSWGTVGKNDKHRSVSFIHSVGWCCIRSA